MRPPERSFNFEGFTLDLRRGCLRGTDGEIELRPKSFEVLRYLVENAGRLVSKDEIMKAVWPNVIVTDESLARCVSDVRLALGDRSQRIIRTVPRRGYLLTVPAAEAEVNLAAPAHTEFGISVASRNGAAAALVEPQLPARRQLTVMACEFAGLAALSRRIDPEDLQAATTACRQSWAAIINRHQGYIARYLEDGLLAYFGYPYASEYDAEHAARAGLALLRSAEQPSASWRAPLQPRIGLATGVVVIAEESAPGGAREPAAVGETPHLAKHLQMAASPRNLVIDQSTRRLIGGLFECRDLGPIVLDGYPEAVPAWQVLEASLADNRFEARRHIGDASDEQIRPPLDPGVDNPASKVATVNGLSPFVGRVRELEVLEGCFAEERAQIRVFDIVGEPGIGKSRLLHEFRQRLNGSRTRIWTGNCWPGDEQMPFRPFIEVVRRTFRLRTADPEAEITRKLEAGLALVGLTTEENLGLLLNLLGLTPPAHLLRGLDDVLVGLRTRDLLLRLAREGCRYAPVVIVLEDLHWVDNASQDLMARLIGMVDAGAIAIIHTRRPGYSPPWAGGQNTTTLALQPLAASETSQIVRARLGVPELTGGLTRLITDRAEGNPLFAEEIANFLIEGGMVHRRATSLEFDAAVVAAAIPASVQSLLTARVDRLTPADRAVLQAAAVIGRRFVPDLLGVVIRTEGVESRLATMQSLDLVRLDNASNEFVFKHALVRDALYASLLSAPRQALHLAIAREIEDRNAGRLGEVAETLAHHYSRADHKEKAIEYLTLVGRKAIGIYSLDEGEHSLRTAFSMVRTEDSERMDEQTANIIVDLAVVYYLQFRSADTIALIEPELGRIVSLGDTTQAAILLDLYGIGLFASCRFREAKQMAERSLAVAERIGDRRSQAHARAGAIMMSVYSDPTPLADFERFAQQAYAEAEEGEDTYTVVRMMMVISWNYLHRGLVYEGRQWAYRLMKFGQERRDYRSQGMALWLLGWLDIIAEDFPSALGFGEECMKTALAPYDRQMGQHVAGISQLLLGRVAEGVETIERNRRHAIENGWQYAALATEAPLGVSLLLSGDLRKGVRALETLVDRCESEYGYRGYADWTRVFIAEFYIALLTGSRKPPLGVVLKNVRFLAISKWTAAKKAKALLRLAIQNPQFSERGVFRARIDFNLGLIQKALGRSDLAQAHFKQAREVAISQEAPAIIAKIDAAMASFS